MRMIKLEKDQNGSNWPHSAGQVVSDDDLIKGVMGETNVNP